MKNALIAFALVFTVAANAQTEPQKTAVATVVTTEVSVPDYLKGATSETLKPENSFPVLGNYPAAAKSTQVVTVSIDPANMGIVWIEGLPQGKIKALLRKSPATYKIPAQQSATGKPVAEGTLYYDPATKEMTILIGKEYNSADPTAFITTNAKTKIKGWQYSGVKSEASPAVTPSVNSN